MHLNIVRESGFCHGVRAAVHKANAQSNGLIYLYGDLVNNRHVMARYIRDGFIVANDVAKIAPGSVVIIRAHGVGRDVYDALAEKNAEIVDCTCVKVKAIHKIVSGKNGVIIIGKKNHPEVLGISGWCENYIVAENSDELAAALASDDVCKAPCVVAQTTCNANFWQTAVAAIRTHRPDAEIFDTLCDVTAKRMENATEMARESDCMIIVGDEKSANSVELFKACETVCEKIFFVSEPEEIADHAPEILACKKIGIAGSASAPAETIEAIHDFLLFADFLNTAKTQIEAASDEYFAGLIEGSKNSFVESAISDLRNQNQNGKRIRGAMILLGCLVAGEGRGARPHTPQGSTAPLTPDAWASSPPLGGRPAPDIVRVAMAYEIFQTAILIHDDVIDKSETRRGRRTIHACEADLHFGVSRAICIGDYGLFLANRILAESGLRDDVLARVFRLFAEIQIKTICGEIMDVSLPVSPVDIMKEYDEYMRIVGAIYDSKTAWYTLAGPLMLGAVCGGADESLQSTLREIALPLGMAFQIKDDLLGVFASEDVLGKPALSDIIEKKQTILYGYAFKHADNEQRVLLEKFYGNSQATDIDLRAVREIFTATGAKKFAEDEISRLSQIALDNASALRDDAKPLVRGLVHYLITRRY